MSLSGSWEPQGSDGQPVALRLFLEPGWQQLQGAMRLGGLVNPETVRATARRAETDTRRQEGVPCRLLPGELSWPVTSDDIHRSWLSAPCARLRNIQVFL